MHSGLSVLQDIPRIAAPCWLVDLESEKFVRVSESALSLFGYSEAEMQAMTTSNIVHPDQRSLVAQRREHARKQWGDGSEWTCVRRDGTCFQMKIRFQLVEYQGKPTYFAFATEWHNASATSA